MRQSAPQRPELGGSHSSLTAWSITPSPQDDRVADTSARRSSFPARSAPSKLVHDGSITPVRRSFAPSVERLLQTARTLVPARVRRSFTLLELPSGATETRPS